MYTQAGGPVSKALDLCFLGKLEVDSELVQGSGTTVIKPT